MTYVYGMASESDEYHEELSSRWSWDGAGPPSSRRGSVEAFMQDPDSMLTRRSMPQRLNINNLRSIEGIETALEMTWIVQGKPSFCHPSPTGDNIVNSKSQTEPNKSTTSILRSSCCSMSCKNSVKPVHKCCDDTPCSDDGESSEDGLVSWFCIPIPRTKKKDDKYNMVASPQDFYIEY